MCLCVWAVTHIGSPVIEAFLSSAGWLWLGVGECWCSVVLGGIGFHPPKFVVDEWSGGFCCVGSFFISSFSPLPPLSLSLSLSLSGCLPAL